MATKAELLENKLKNGSPREGAIISWISNEIKRSGVIWSKAIVTNGYWVIPDDLKTIDDLVLVQYKKNAEPNWQELEEN